MSTRPLPMPVNPALLQHAEERRKSLENRIADQITRFAGSMRFVYLHVVWFAGSAYFRWGWRSPPPISSMPGR